jgi:membrane-anchored glycerophosphoryl diester phosphodiesterase (GDPDase)
MVLGLFALIIGIFFVMLYLMTLYLFILPILMAEGPNIGNAISRTFKLVHRRFWPNIGWVAIFIIIIMVISLILSGIILLPFTGSFLKILSNPAEAGAAMEFITNPFYLALSALASAVYMPLVPIFAVILYFNGKAREEEISTQDTGSSEPDKVRVEDLYAKPKE